MKPSTTLNRLCNFIGLLKHYFNMCERHSHTLEPLTKLTSNKLKFKWNKVKQKLIVEIKSNMDRNTILE